LVVIQVWCIIIILTHCVFILFNCRVLITMKCMDRQGSRCVEQAHHHHVEVHQCVAVVVCHEEVVVCQEAVVACHEVVVVCHVDLHHQCQAMKMIVAVVGCCSKDQFWWCITWTRRKWTARGCLTCSVSMEMLWGYVKGFKFQLRWWLVYFILEIDGCSSVYSLN